MRKRKYEKEEILTGLKTQLPFLLAEGSSSSLPFCNSHERSLLCPFNFVWYNYCFDTRLDHIKQMREIMQTYFFFLSTFPVGTQENTFLEIFILWIVWIFPDYHTNLNIRIKWIAYYHIFFVLLIFNFIKMCETETFTKLKRSWNFIPKFQ